MKRLLAGMVILAVSLVGVPVGAVPEENATEGKRDSAIMEHCEEIKESLKNIQKADARARVYLGRYYETILTDYIKPLNVRLVENNLSSASLVENQNKIADTKTLFTDDYIGYQQNLEELVTMDCKNNPENFYNKLEKVRQKRKIVEQDTLKMRNLLSEHVNLADNLKKEL